MLRRLLTGQSAKLFLPLRVAAIVQGCVWHPPIMTDAEAGGATLPVSEAAVGEQPPAAAPADASGEVPPPDAPACLSKNALKRLRKQEEWEQRKAQRKAEEKVRQKEASQQRREEAQKVRRVESPGGTTQRAM